MIRLVDIRCPTAGCGKKLAEAISGTRGEIQIMCPRCKRVMTIKLG